ncbi:hypothetical protein H0H92_010654 [Tricholoma furcatifolium]|nr:hypothetical protein H0H92_010654 [Tricholoma furcatifolium]
MDVRLGPETRQQSSTYQTTFLDKKATFVFKYRPLVAQLQAKDIAPHDKKRKRDSSVHEIIDLTKNDHATAKPMLDPRKRVKKEPTISRVKEESGSVGVKTEGSILVNRTSTQQLGEIIDLTL